MKERNVFVSVAGKSTAAVGAAGKGAENRQKVSLFAPRECSNAAFLGTFGKKLLPISRDNRNFAGR